MNNTLDDDDLESIEELRNLLLKENSVINFVGTFSTELDNTKFPINSLYKLNNIVYINTKYGWEKFVEDGKNGIDGKGIPGGGLGLNDVIRTVKNTYIDANNIFSNATFTHSSATNLNDILQDFDTSIGSGGGNFSGSIDSSAVNIPPIYVNTSATTLDIALKDFDRVIYTKVLFGEYAINDVFEETYLYACAASLSGSWYIKRVEESGDDIFLRYANISNNPLIITYQEAINNRETLIYDLIQNITL